MVLQQQNMFCMSIVLLLKHHEQEQESPGQKVIYIL